jgi:hypothetical protein
MKSCKYDPYKYGDGKLRADIVNFMEKHNISANEFRGFDDAPKVYWNNKIATSKLTSFSRVIDKLFYSQDK